MATDRQIRQYWREEFVLIGLVLFVFIGNILFALHLPFDAKLFPTVIGCAGALLCFLIVIAEFRRWRTQAASAIRNDDPATHVEWQRYALALGSTPVFGLLLWLLGFFVASLAAMIAMPWLMGFRDRKVIALVTVVTIVILTLIFPYFVGVNLPHGIVGDWLIDRLNTH